jgi:hypothetical protein
MLLGLTGDSEIAHWAAGGGVVTNVTNVVTYVSRVGGDMGVCHHTVMLMLMVSGVLLPLPVWVLFELRLRKQFYAQELLAAEGVVQQQQQAGSSSTVSSSRDVSGGDVWRWQNSFHMPVAALAQCVLAVSMVSLLGLVKLGPHLLRLQGIIAE